MYRLTNRLLKILMLAGALSLPAGMANAYTISFAPDIDFGAGGAGTYDSLAIDFGGVTHTQAAYALGTPNSVWITGGGAIGISAGVEISATVTIETGANSTFLPLAAVFEDASGSLATEIVLSPALSSSFTTQIYNVDLPFSAQAAGYDLYFGLKFNNFFSDNVDISGITLDLTMTEAPTAQVSAPGATAIFGACIIAIAMAHRKRRPRSS